MNINNYHGEGSGNGYRDGFGNDIGKGKNNGHGKGSKDRRLSLNQYKTGDARKSFPSNPTTNNINNK